MMNDFLDDEGIQISIEEKCYERPNSLCNHYVKIRGTMEYIKTKFELLSKHEIIKLHNKHNIPLPLLDGHFKLGDL